MPIVACTRADARTDANSSTTRTCRADVPGAVGRRDPRVPAEHVRLSRQHPAAPPHGSTSRPFVCGHTSRMAACPRSPWPACASRTARAPGHGARNRRSSSTPSHMRSPHSWPARTARRRAGACRHCAPACRRAAWRPNLVRAVELVVHEARDDRRLADALIT